MNLDAIIKEFEERQQRYRQWSNDNKALHYNAGYADGLQSALLIFYRLKVEGLDNESTLS